MSWEEFCKYASQFIKVSNKLNDGWTCMEYEVGLIVHPLWCFRHDVYLHKVSLLVL